MLLQRGRVQAKLKDTGIRRAGRIGTIPLICPRKREAPGREGGFGKGTQRATAAPPKARGRGV